MRWDESVHERERASLGGRIPRLSEHQGKYTWETSGEERWMLAVFANLLE